MTVLLTISVLLRTEGDMPNKLRRLGFANRSTDMDLSLAFRLAFTVGLSGGSRNVNDLSHPSSCCYSKLSVCCNNYGYWKFQ